MKHGWSSPVDRLSCLVLSTARPVLSCRPPVLSCSVDRPSCLVLSRDGGVLPRIHTAVEH
jgi:hypothetical protein